MTRPLVIALACLAVTGCGARPLVYDQQAPASIKLASVRFGHAVQKQADGTVSVVCDHDAGAHYVCSARVGSRTAVGNVIGDTARVTGWQQ